MFSGGNMSIGGTSGIHGTGSVPEQPLSTGHAGPLTGAEAKQSLQEAPGEMTVSHGISANLESVATAAKAAEANQAAATAALAKALIEPGVDAAINNLMSAVKLARGG
jgi:hypothetical protein